MQRHGDVLAYYNETDYMSHMYRCEFWHRGLLFEHVEKFIMYGKAMTFNDLHSAALIMRTNSPYDCKNLGRRVANFNQETWDHFSPRIATVGNREKYFQNRSLAQMLVQTEPLILAEGSFNTTWGAGLAKTDARIGTPIQWPGRNLAGQCVMQVRRELISAGF